MRRFASGTFVCFACLVLLVVHLAVGIAHADDFDLNADQVKAALHTATDEEGGFVDRTLGMVQAGTLPRDLFTSTFLWARKKTHRKFQYFKQGLTLRAAEIGITL